MTLPDGFYLPEPPAPPQPLDVAWQVDDEIERDEDGIVWSADVKSGQLSAYVKRDGCIDLWDTNGGNIHICDLDDLIARLHALKAFAVNQWPDGEGGW